MLINNINTKYYWNKRFSSGDWEVKQGRDQTRNFAISQIRHLNISKDYTGTILDFGCGLGDAFPIYKKAFPKAKLIGLDISEEAIKKCKEKYGNLAIFICGTHDNVPTVDLIMASNVFEHLTDDVSIAKHLLKKCQQLKIIVPYKEKITIGSEHINTYYKDSFQSIGTYNYKIFVSRGWSHAYGINMIYHVHLKNIIRILIGKPVIKNPKQILYSFRNLPGLQDNSHMLYLMHISWHWIKQRPQFLAENLSPYFNLTVLFTENKPSHNKFIISEKPVFVKSIKILSLGRFSFIRKINGKIIEIHLRKLIKYNEIIWLTSPTYYYQIKKYIKPTQTLIYDCMDDILEFPDIKNNHELLNEYFEKEGKLISRADIIFVSSMNLLKKIKSRYQISCNPILLNNAISNTFFTENEEMEENIINDFPAKEEFIDLVYIGTISAWFDFELIIKSLIKYIQIRYILIGPTGIKIPDHDRIIYLGIKKHSELIPYMKKADSLIMPFLVNDLIESVNPVKLYEYIYSGKPVITCSYNEINQFDDFVYRYNSEIEYFQLLERLINNELKQKDIKRCQKFAMQNTWEKRVEIIRSALFQLKKT